jgi:ribosome biogenesis GTPase
LERGLVIKSTGSRYRVKNEKGGIIECVIKGRFRMEGIRTTNPIAVGDYVFYELEEGAETGMIKKIEARKNYIIRKSSNLSKESQIIAANIDYALLMVSLREPVTPVEFIDRYLVTAEAYRIKAMLIFNKTDIYNKNDLKRMKSLSAVYADAGYKCYSISLINNDNIDLIKDILKNRVTLVSGNSGVGKSTLLNHINPELNIKVSEISDYHKQGKHTTSFAEMYPIPDGGFIIDTPGIRGFGLTDMAKDEIYHFFPEIFRKSDKCKYYNCLHINEPGCAVKDAVERGNIEKFRYRSYINIFNDSDSKYR